MPRAERFQSSFTATTTRFLTGGTFRSADRWLDPLDKTAPALYTLAQGRTIMRLLIDELNNMIIAAVKPFAARGARHLKLTETLAKQPGYAADYKVWWLNELHPTQRGYDVLAAVADAAIAAALAPAPAPTPTPAPAQHRHPPEPAAECRRSTRVPNRRAKPCAWHRMHRRACAACASASASAPLRRASLARHTAFSAASRREAALRRATFGIGHQARRSPLIRGCCRRQRQRAAAIAHAEGVRG